MRYSRPVRLVLGILILAFFGFYVVRWFSTAVWSNDVGRPKPAATVTVPVQEQQVQQAA